MHMTGDTDSMNHASNKEAAAAADRFSGGAHIAAVRDYGKGNINDTFLATLDSGERKRFILQRINTRVFSRPELVMSNMRILTEHICARLEKERLSDGRRWETPRVLSASDGLDYWIDPGGSFWRAITFIESSESFVSIQNVGHAKEVGCALGLFQSLISDLPAEWLADTLEGFHITPRYLLRYDEVVAKTRVARSPEVNYGLRFVNERRASACVLEDAKERGKLRLRPIHGDPKVNNVMMDSATGRAVCLVDLDTVKPGLIHYDIGDCLRSCCNLLGEEPARLDDVRFETDLCRPILQGYLSQARGFLTENDYEYLYDAIRLISFELGLRFLTDYLEGDVYFKARHPEQNLIRAMVQFRLTESIERQEAAIRAAIRDVR